MTSMWRAAARSRSGGHTSRFTSRPTAIPMPVSISRSASIPLWPTKPVVSTTTAVVAVVTGARRPGAAPASIPTRTVAPSAKAVAPNSAHAPEAMSTPSTLAPACCAPRCRVPNTVAWTVRSAAHGAMNACERWNT